MDRALHQKFIIVADGLTGDLVGVKVLSPHPHPLLSRRGDKETLRQDHRESQVEEDGILDIRLYSTQFHADMASLWLQELGLSPIAVVEALLQRSQELVVTCRSPDCSLKMLHLYSTQDERRPVNRS